MLSTLGPSADVELSQKHLAYVSRVHQVRVRGVEVLEAARAEGGEEGASSSGGVDLDRGSASEPNRAVPSMTVDLGVARTIFLA